VKLVLHSANGGKNVETKTMTALAGRPVWPSEVGRRKPCNGRGSTIKLPAQTVSSNPKIISTNLQYWPTKGRNIKRVERRTTPTP
jgi:hypothetical protein